MRGIDERFIKDLKEGELSFFLEQVRSDRKRFTLEIRDGYINIYYRGGNILKITQNKRSYSFHFDERYCLYKDKNPNLELLKHLKLQSAKDNFKLMMEEMDEWFKIHPKKEREIQQELLDKLSVIDIEYAKNYENDEGEKRGMRLDMLVVDGDKLIVVENKYGQGSIGGKSGIAKHYEDMCRVLKNHELHSEIINSVLNISDAKYQLGLIGSPITALEESKTEFLFIFVNYNRRSKAIQNAVDTMKDKYKDKDKRPAKLMFVSKNGKELVFEETMDLFEYKP